MAVSLPRAIGKIAYAVLFVALLPALLIAWARATASIVTVPVLDSPPVGAAFVGSGALLMVGGWISLWRHGGGLPMNAFPPPRYVSKGAYAVTRHPIYVGFCAICFGVSIAAGSSSGFWLVSPTMVLVCTALVLGYERRDLEARFGATDARPWLALPRDEPGSPTLAERLSLYPMVMLLWGALYQAVAIVGAAPDALGTHFAFEAQLPVLEWTEAIYVSIYAVALGAPLAARSRRDLRALALRALLASALVFPIYLALPLIAPPRPFEPHGVLGELLALERAMDTPAAAFPSFHVIWALLATDAWASRFPALRPAWRGLAIAIAASCVTTGMHSIVDVVAGAGAYALVVRGAAVWEAIRAGAERVANSWHERRVGPMRIINHGGWAALGTFGGVLIIGTIIGPGHTLAISAVTLGAIICSALWAQLVEGSPSLLRPYGWYGGVLGVIGASLAAPLSGTSTWLVLAASCVAAPWIQAAGRMRCLVQGCCHGSAAPPSIGIRYTHPRSRVCRLSDLGGVPVHPTPVYSILWNVVTAIVVARLWSLRAPLHFVAGVFIALNGVGRFVEESYRGEPQTPVYAGLRFYQWVAIGAVVAGAVVSAVSTSAPAPSAEPNGQALLCAAIFGVVTWFALGVDFPGSNRRFARLV